MGMSDKLGFVGGSEESFGNLLGFYTVLIGNSPSLEQAKRLLANQLCKPAHQIDP